MGVFIFAPLLMTFSVLGIETLVRLTLASWSTFRVRRIRQRWWFLSFKIIPIVRNVDSCNLVCHSQEWVQYRGTCEPNTIKLTPAEIFGIALACFVVFLFFVYVCYRKRCAAGTPGVNFI